MQIFPRKSKKVPNSYYFGEYNDFPIAPMSVSLAEFDFTYQKEHPYYHTDTQKIFITLEGKGVLNVNGQSVIMEPEAMIHLEPGDIHFVEKISDAPLKFVAITSAKINDKVVIKD